MSIKFVENKDDLDKRLEEAGDQLVVLDFFANWCGPCRMIGPKLEEYAKEHTDVVFLKVEVDNNADLAKEYNIVVMPTMIFIKRKMVIQTFSGSHYDKVLSMIKDLK